jgi:glycosyltransferase involved in cell wall biosynthesis
MEKISVIIISKNEEKNIRECIDSVLWADEINIVDSFSEDKTIEIAKSYPDINVFQNIWEGFNKQREFALTKCNFDWIFSIDADERCTKELQNEILDTINNKNLSCSGYKIPRKSFFLGKWVKHCGWYPSYQMRLFKKSAASVSGRLVHEKYEVKGNNHGILKNDLIHFTVQSISGYMDKVNQYSTLQAKEKMNRKKIGLCGIIFRTAFAYFEVFILKAGFLDGVTGLMVTNFHAITRMLTYMKIRELQNNINKPG